MSGSAHIDSHEGLPAAATHPVKHTGFVNVNVYLQKDGRRLEYGCGKGGQWASS